MARNIEDIPLKVRQQMETAAKNIHSIRRKTGETAETFAYKNVFGSRPNYDKYQRDQDPPFSCVLMICHNYNVELNSLLERQVKISELKDDSPEIAQMRIRDMEDKIQLLNQIITMKDQVTDGKVMMLNDREVALQACKNQVYDLNEQIKNLENENDELKKKLRSFEMGDSSLANDDNIGYMRRQQ